MVQFSEYKARKEGKVTPLSLAENVLAAAERGEVKHLICISLCQDGTIKAGYSTMDVLKLMGLLEAGKDEIKAILAVAEEEY